MLRFKVQPYNSVWISADSQEELGRTFIRFQEFYESPNPDFKNNIFTLGMVRNWYSIKYGGDTYEKDWTGFNFPSKVLIPFKQGLFDPLTLEEVQVLDYFKYRHDNFYIIGAQDNATLRHELAHALYLYDPIYRRKIDQICTINKKEISIVRKYIIDKGYAEDVVNDELQAYITDNDDPFIVKNTPEHILKKINKLYTKHNVAKT